MEKYGFAAEDKLKTLLSEEMAKEFDKEIISQIREIVITESKNYLYTLINNKTEKDLELLIKKYNLIEKDLLNLQNIKLKIREYNIDSIINKN